MMRGTKLNVARLQTRDLRAWTTLLKRAGQADLAVESVKAEPIDHHRTRYLITLVGHSDPISLLAKKTNAREAHFYRHLAATMPSPAPRCWLSYAGDDGGWVVVDDVPNERLPETWSADDVNSIVDDLAQFHAMFWNRAGTLDQFPWLPSYVGAANSAESYHNGNHDPAPPHYFSRGTLASEHALECAGPLGPQWVQAAAGLHTLRDLGGWPDVVTDKHLQAAADLIDDPVPVLRPLRELPPTLLHGYPGIYNWRVTVFDERRIVDWKTVASGPAVCDLAVFLETFELLQHPEDGWTMRHAWPASEETIVDSYILRLSAELAESGTGFDARAVRRALPAARCLYVLLHWFPRFDKWFRFMPDEPEVVPPPQRLTDEQRLSSAIRPNSGLQPHLAATFRRFLIAYHQL